MTWEIAPALNGNGRRYPVPETGLLEVATSRGCGGRVIPGGGRDSGDTGWQEVQEQLWWEKSKKEPCGALSHGSSGWARKEFPKNSDKWFGGRDEGSRKATIVISVHRMFLSKIVLCGNYNSLL
jgi:hypothetical protein